MHSVRCAFAICPIPISGTYYQIFTNAYRKDTNVLTVSLSDIKRRGQVAYQRDQTMLSCQ